MTLLLQRQQALRRENSGQCGRDGLSGAHTGQVHPGMLLYERGRQASSRMSGTRFVVTIGHVGPSRRTPTNVRFLVFGCRLVGSAECAVPAG